MKRYNIINNTLGWLCFAIAAVTYLLTVEPTASFWDCPEFISQGLKLEVGHPPGNPIFILAARFFINFAGGDPSNAAIAVNIMSGLLSAGTILLLFWTITHLVRRMMVGRSEEELPLSKLIVVMGSGICGALLYTWSDTFWFSAVEGEVYAFSSFCTALVFWLILKWDTRADRPHSDRYLVLVAYVIGISIAVHLLNLLTIPALALVIYFRKWENTTLKGSLIALFVSFVTVALILYGLVPGFVENSQYFELFFVNVLGMRYNVGVLIYALILVGVLLWCVTALYRQNSPMQIRISFILSVILSGIPFIGSSIITPIIIIAALCIYIFCAKKLYLRVLNIIALSILVIFVGYSSYALLLIRSEANPPMNQNAPDNVFALSSYLNREQYGQTPLLYGPSFASTAIADVDITSNPVDMVPHANKKTVYGKVVKQSPDEPDRYVKYETDQSYQMTPNMIFPRMYSTQPGHPEGYLAWIGETMESLPTEVVAPYYDARTGKVLRDAYGDIYEVEIPKPSLAQNLRYFFNYQLGYMYWRYFMWNFAGRQNDIQGLYGEPNRGNWISGIPFIDNSRLGDQSLMPDDMSKGNKGHNVFYMLPLLMGLIGIGAQMARGNEGVRQFWIIFFLFFMTGIAIVLYLNQPPLQPRERDYAFAGSFYAYAIWIGMGVYGIWLALKHFIKKDSEKSNVAIAAVASLIGLAIPLQMVSQTWDDHDRSGRYTTRDFGMNYLSSLDENAIIFTNGDNDTFPLWYAQEVEGYRTDVRVVNLAYLTTDWYVNHTKMPANEAAAILTQAQPKDYAYDRMQFNNVDADPSVTVPVSVFASLNDLYTNPDAQDKHGVRKLRYPHMYIPVSVEEAVAAGVVSPRDSAYADDFIEVDLSNLRSINLSQAVSLDMIAHGITNGWKRPAYFAMTVPDDYYLNMSGNLATTGLAYQVTPLWTDTRNGDMGVSTDKMYDNVMNRFRWGGLDKEDADIYLDETVRRMVTTHRSALLDLARGLYNEGIVALYGKTSQEDPEPTDAERDENAVFAHDRFTKAVNVLDLMQEKLPVRLAPYAIQIGDQIGVMYASLGEELGDDALIEKGLDILEAETMRYGGYINYFASLLNAEKRRAVKQAQAEGRYNTQSVADGMSIYNLNLQKPDLYIPYYVYTLVQDYTDFAGRDRGEKLIDKMSKAYGSEVFSNLGMLLPPEK